MAYCESLDRTATCGANCVADCEELKNEVIELEHGQIIDMGCVCGACGQIVDMHGQDCEELKNEAIELEHGQITESLEWTKDGQVRTRVIGSLRSMCPPLVM
eukprot:3094456-Pyramimonas_sp.AAC.1